MLIARYVTLFFWIWGIGLFGSCEFVSTVDAKNGAKITEIVSTVAHTRALSLLSKRKHLDDLGDQVAKEVPFLQFWGYIFSNPKLTHDMKLIQNSSFKYNSFISGGREAVLKDYDSNKECFLKQVDGFAVFLKLDPKTTTPLAQSSLESFRTYKNGLKPFFDYLIAERLKSTTSSH